MKIRGYFTLATKGWRTCQLLNLHYTYSN